MDTIDFTKIQPQSWWIDTMEKSGFLARWKIRDNYIASVGFPIYTSETLEKLVRFLDGKKVVDVGCGTAFLAKQLQDRGINVTPVDNYVSSYREGLSFKNRSFTKVVCKDASKLHFSKYDVVIMSWPDYDSDFAERIVKRMRPGQILIYQGEGTYGCTGNDAFHYFLCDRCSRIDNDLNDHHVQFYAIHDWWYIYRKDR